MAWAWLWWHGGKGKEKGTRGERGEVFVTVSLFRGEATRV